MGGWSNDNRDTIEWLGNIKAVRFIGDFDFANIDGGSFADLITNTPQVDGGSW